MRNNPVVIELGKLHKKDTEGNIIPHSWYRTRKRSGAPGSMI